jgi:hypothetical protein
MRNYSIGVVLSAASANNERLIDNKSINLKDKKTKAPTLPRIRSLTIKMLIKILKYLKRLRS